MSSQTARTGAPAAPHNAGVSSGSNPWLIAVLVALASFMEVLDTTIANVALPYIAGGVGVSEDEASWVVTTYLVANAISLTASGFLARRLGRKAFFVGCLALFTISSVLSGLAWNLQSLLLFRIMQGLGGGGMVPVSQSILADAFPPEKRGQGFALFGVAVVVAPVVGPTLGGWLSDNWSWHWCFLINGPVGLFAMAMIAAILREPATEKRRQLQQKGRFDLIGFVLAATFLGALELMLDRGLEDDWFSSSFIIIVATICAVAFMLMIPWEISRPNPMIDLRMIATRQFGTSLLVMLGAGAIMFSTTQFLPQLVQQNFGYTATWAGLVLSPGGVVTMVMMFIVGPLSGKVQPKYLIMAGALITALSMYDLTNVYGDLGFWFFSRSRILLGVGLPLIFLPILAAAYDGIPPDKTDQASALINVARNTGGSIGVSLASNVLAHREQFHQGRLAEHTIPSSVPYKDTLQQVTDYFAAHGSSLAEAHQQAIAWIGQQLQAQAAFLAYMDVFWVLTLISLAAVPLALSLRKVKLGGAAPMAH
ncbi:DHA2 family efflux MFS transporter permease subunit [Pseudaminobacter soli (ex Li et al. 2025)]|uniref:EmrB/QacA family drug resistance transporter n=1 Tax=Pseudaminobacter soli (ex Li et al. 2025) TaxID=1295366 RepID=A0A2P7SKK0_9HYPH|nr:DHA2 family efflux MFS transporter permease subunit [Mesorhizobium soli]PSJ62861.1 EmrB/QacA family drug resistance transporter [Mesorhizobium soli]